MLDGLVGTGVAGGGRPGSRGEGLGGHGGKPSQDKQGSRGEVVLTFCLTSGQPQVDHSLDNWSRLNAFKATFQNYQTSLNWFVWRDRNFRITSFLLNTNNL